MPKLSQTDLMMNYDLEGTVFGDFDLRDDWEETVNVAVCNATCYGILDPCADPAIAAKFNLDCNDDGAHFADMGPGYCRDIDNAKVLPQPVPLSLCFAMKGAGSNANANCNALRYSRTATGRRSPRAPSAASTARCARAASATSGRTTTRALCTSPTS